jgi:ATP-binding protein involved in chromosome partitioning
VIADAAHAPPPGVAEQLAAHRRAIETRLADVSMVVAVMSGKGGVGKTAVTANLAAHLGAQGYRVGAVDADLSGRSLARVLGASGQRPVLHAAGVRPALGAGDVHVMAIDFLMADRTAPLEWRHAGGLAADAFVWRGVLEANALRELIADTDWGRLDYLFVDLPPGSDRFEAAARILPRIDAVVAVTIPSGVAVEVVGRSLQSVRAASGATVGTIVNMAGVACDRCGELTPLFGGPSAEEIAAAWKTELLAAVPFDPRLSAAADRGLPLVLSEPEAPASIALAAAAARLAGGAG